VTSRTPALPPTRAPSLPLGLALALNLAVVVGVGCGERNALDGYDVVVKKTAECTVTGDFSRQCEDPAVLAQTALEARWYVEIAGDDASATVTTHEGRTLPGLRFTNDASVINVDGCAGEGGNCLFVRRRFTTTDDNNNGCSTFGELIFVGHAPPDDQERLTGFFSDVSGNTAECGTQTVNEVVFSVEGRRVETPARAAQEAAQ